MRNKLHTLWLIPLPYMGHVSRKGAFEKAHADLALFRAIIPASSHDINHLYSLKGWIWCPLTFAYSADPDLPPRQWRGGWSRAALYDMSECPFSREVAQMLVKLFSPRHAYLRIYCGWHLKTLWEIEHLLIRSKRSIFHNVFKTIAIKQYFFFEIMLSKLKIKHDVTI